MVRPLAVAICDLLVLGGLGDREILQPRLGPEKGQKRQKVDLPGLGGRSGLDAPRLKLFAC